MIYYPVRTATNIVKVLKFQSFKEAQSALIHIVHFSNAFRLHTSYGKNLNIANINIIKFQAHFWHAKINTP